MLLASAPVGASPTVSATFITARAGDTLAIRNVQQEQVTGVVRVVGGLSVPFALAPGAESPVPVPLPATGGDARWIIAIEASDVVHVESAPLPLLVANAGAAEDRSTTLPFSFRPGADTATVVLAAFAGEVRVSVYDLPESGAPIAVQRYAATGSERAVRVALAQLIPRGMQILNGRVRVEPLSGQAVAAIQQPPGRRRAVGHRGDDALTMSLRGSAGCAHTPGGTSRTPAAAGASYAWALTNLTPAGATDRAELQFGYGQAGYGTLRLTVTADGQTRTAVTHVRIRPQPNAAIEGPATAAVEETLTLTAPAGADAYSWEITSGGAVITEGQGTSQVGLRATASGPLRVALTVFIDGGCSASTTHRMDVVEAVAATATLTFGAPSAIWGGAGIPLTIDVTGLTATEDWRLASSINNVFDHAEGTGSGRFARWYAGANNHGTDTVRVIRTSDGAELGSATIQVHLPPEISAFSASKNTAWFGEDVTLTFTIARVTAWRLTSSLGNNGFDTSSGTGAGTFTVNYCRCDAVGRDEITLTVTALDGISTETRTLVIDMPAPTITSFTADSMSVKAFDSTPLRFTIVGAEAWQLTSSRNNSFAQTSGTGSGSFVIDYIRDGNAHADEITLTATSRWGSASASLTIQQPPGVLDLAPDVAAVARGGTTVIRFRTFETSTWRITSSLGNTLSPSSGSIPGTVFEQINDVAAQYTRDTADGADTITVTVDGPGGTAMASYVITMPSGGTAGAAQE